MIKRLLTATVFCFGLATPAAQASVPDNGELAFEVYRNGDRFGQHILTFEENGEDLQVTVDIDFRVGLGPIPLWRYRHDIRETWRDGRLVSLEATTRKDGRDLEVEASLGDDDLLSVRGEDFEGALPGRIIPSSYWNPDIIEQGQMLNTETGELMDLAIEELGVETILAGGSYIAASRYRLIGGPIPFDLWYDADGHWVKMSFTIDGSEIDYVLAEAPGRT